MSAFPTVPARSADSADTAIARHRFLQKISNDADLPALGITISRVVQLTSSDDEASHNLTHFILSDVALTQKILRLSNTAYYRTAWGAPVTTISRAIFLLGVDAIKTSALAMLLVDCFSDYKHAQGVQSELMQALCASVVGRELARYSYHQRAEEAAIAALFKNLGRLLVAAHEPALYGEMVALSESGGLTPSQASMRVLGCNLDLLAESVLREWQIPQAIIHALTPVGAGVLKPANHRQEWMQQVVAFSAQAAALIPRIGDTGEVAGSQALLTRFGTALNLDQDKLNRLFSTVAQEIHTLAESMHLALPPTAAFAAPGAPDAHLVPVELLMGDGDSQASDARHASGKPRNAHQLLLTGVQDVTQMMASGRCNVNELTLLVLETLYRSMGFRFATICFKDPKTEQFRARTALGEDYAVRQAGFAFPIAAAHDLFHLALENDADLMIADASSANIRALLPAWHRQLLPDARSFIVLPLVVQKVPLGLFYADRSLTTPEGVPADEAALIKILKGQVLAALNPR